MLVVIDERIIHDDLSALTVEGKGHLLHTLVVHRGAHGILACGFGVKQKESSTTGPGYLAAQRAMLARHPVEVVDARAGNAVGYAFLGLPGIVEQIAEVFQVAAQESLFGPLR